MRLKFLKPMSRLKKKLMIYFILIAIVSISVSAEIILEMSSPKFQEAINLNYYKQLESKMPHEDVAMLIKETDSQIIFKPVYDLRNRMVLLLFVVSASIIGAFFMFTKDIVSPMDGIVKATQKIAKGNLAITVPVLTKDEIGQIADLINEMNINLRDMILQTRHEINRQMGQIAKASYKIGEVIDDKETGNAVKSRKIRLSNFKMIIQNCNEVIDILENMNDEFYEFEKFLKMYKTFKARYEISQVEIDDALNGHDYHTSDLL